MTALPAQLGYYNGADPEPWVHTELATQDTVFPYINKQRDFITQPLSKTQQKLQDLLKDQEGARLWAFNDAIGAISHHAIRYAFVKDYKSIFKHKSEDEDVVEEAVPEDDDSTQTDELDEIDGLA